MSATFVSVPAYLVLLMSPLWWIGDPALLAASARDSCSVLLCHGSSSRALSTGTPRIAVFALKRRHALHHHVTPEGNFGVTSGPWDRVFATDIQPRRNPRRAQPNGRHLAER
ncbi:sterol desaturase family protein [Ensifer sp. ENS11]|nr:MULTISPECIES: sterol desaturase family protein [unclassified Ensifer]MBD9487019.1 sterol desaturase family protein [Ensifer sp. ENS11]